MAGRAAAAATDAGWCVEDFDASLLSLAPATRSAYRHDVEAFVAWATAAGITSPASVDRRTVRSYLASIATGDLTERRPPRSPRSIPRALSAVRRWFAWLRRRGQVAVDPTAGLSAPRGEARLPRVLRAAEVHRLLEEPPAAVVASDTPAIRVRDDAICELLYGSGLRVSELT